MGFFIWVVLTFYLVLAGYAAAARWFPERPVSERIVVSACSFWALVLFTMLPLGAFHQLARVPVGLLALLLASGLLAAALKKGGLAGLRRQLALDGSCILEAARELRRRPCVALLAVIPGSLALGIVLLSVWYFKTWSWDALWYHAPMIHHMLEWHTLGPIPSHVPQMSFPRNIELLGAWNCIFPMDSRLDDSAQAAFLLTGMVLVFAWSRRVGASVAWALSLAFAWVALPPVFLLAGTGDIDIATAVLLAITVFHLSRGPAAKDFCIALLTLGIYLGAKYQAVVHAALLSPWFLFRGVQILRAGRPRSRALLKVLVPITLCLLLGSYFYVENAVRWGNPLYPVAFHIPLTAVTLPGSTASDLFPSEVEIWNRGTSELYFQQPGEFVHLVGSWFQTNLDYIPDVKGGGFGPLFRWLMLPVLIFALGDALRLRRWREHLPLLVLVVVAFGVPMTYFPRYIIGAALGCMVLVGLFASQLPGRALPLLLGVTFAGLCWQGFTDAETGSRRFSPFYRYFNRARTLSTAERVELQVDANLWPSEWVHQREAEFRAGDLFLYDEGGYFLSELSCRDLRSRVTFLSSRSEPKTYTAELVALHPRWVGVHQRGPGRPVVEALGGQFLFVAPQTELAIYRMPWAKVP